jgi:hypothetical protein
MSVEDFIMQHFASGVQTGEHRFIRSIRALVHALAEDTPAARADASVILYVRLTGAERAAIARAVAGLPPEVTPETTTPKEAAARWARRADAPMRNAVAGACFRMLTPDDHKQFLAWIATHSHSEGHDHEA